jgi:AcrR family transcriptional regulator
LVSDQSAFREARCCAGSAVPAGRWTTHCAIPCIDPGGRPPVRLRAVEVAATLISSRNVGAATFDAVSAEADCSVHSLYAVFGSRDSLLETVFDSYLAEVDFDDITAGSSPDLNTTVRQIYGAARSFAQLEKLAGRRSVCRSDPGHCPAAAAAATAGASDVFVDAFVRAVSPA